MCLQAAANSSSCCMLRPSRAFTLLLFTPPTCISLYRAYCRAQDPQPLSCSRLRCVCRVGQLPASAVLYNAGHMHSEECRRHLMRDAAKSEEYGGAAADRAQ